MHAVGHVGSAAIPVFLAGNRRTCAPLTRFFFHEYHWTFSGPQTLNRIGEAVQRLRSDIELSREIVKSRAQISPEILRALDGQAPSVILSSEEAKTHGLVEDVLDLSANGDDGMRVAHLECLTAFPSHGVEERWSKLVLFDVCSALLIGCSIFMRTHSVG